MKAFIAAVLFGFVVIVAGCAPSEEEAPDMSTNAPSTNAPAPDAPAE